MWNHKWHGWSSKTFSNGTIWIPGDNVIRRSIWDVSLFVHAIKTKSFERVHQEHLLSFPHCFSSMRFMIFIILQCEMCWKKTPIKQHHYPLLRKNKKQMSIFEMTWKFELTWFFFKIYFMLWINDNYQITYWFDYNTS